MMSRSETDSKTLFLTYYKIKKLAFAFLALPLFLFLVFSVRRYISIPIAVTLIVVSMITAKRKRNKTAKTDLEPSEGIRIKIWF